jgi:hypothetical protein
LASFSRHTPKKHYCCCRLSKKEVDCKSADSWIESGCAT